MNETGFEEKTLVNEGQRDRKEKDEKGQTKNRDGQDRKLTNCET